MLLEKLLTEPESKTLEFKRDLSSLDPILKTIVAFANTAGGCLIIGKSSDGILLGLPDVFKAEETLASAISDNIRPSILPDIEIATVEGKHLIVVRVPHWKAPFYVKKEGMPKGVYIRLGSTNRPAAPEILADLQRAPSTLAFDQQPLLHASPDMLNTSLEVEKLRSLGVLAQYGRQIVPSIGGMILFGQEAYRQQFVPDARIGCARFQGDTKARIIDKCAIPGTIIDAAVEVPKFIARNTRLAAQIEGMYRKDIPEYSPLAIREAFINALAHADYSQAGSYIQIAIFSDRLEIQNPGALPLGFTLEDFKAGVSRVRNRVIARVFHELRLMEEWGSGYRRIMEACREGGYPEPAWEELGSTLRVTFYPHPATVIQPPPSWRLQETQYIDREAALLHLLERFEALPFREIYKRLAPLGSPRTLRYGLSALQRKGLVQSRGKGRATVWQTKDK